MSRTQNIGTSAEWFVGTNKTLPFEIYSDDEVTIEDVTGWACRWVLRRAKDDDPIILDKTTVSGITISGTYNADPAVNTQRVYVATTPSDTQHLQPGRYYHALKRTDSGFEDILSEGVVHLKKAAL
jgi:hypothetical protein